MSNSTSEKVLISVIVPVYNVETYLQDCIDSLLNQTFRSLELIFVDDASTDSCGEILDRNAKEHPDLIKVIHLPDNRKLGGARNAGLAVAEGEYIGFVDSDDMVLPDMYEVLYKSAAESGSDVSFITVARIPKDKTYRDAISDYQNKIELSPYIPITSEIRRYNEIDKLTTDDKDYLYVTRFTGGVWAGLWKKKTITDNRVFFPEHIFYEDYFQRFLGSLSWR